MQGKYMDSEIIMGVQSGVKTGDSIQLLGKALEVRTQLVEKLTCC